MRRQYGNGDVSIVADRPEFTQKGLKTMGLESPKRVGVLDMNVGEHRLRAFTEMRNGVEVLVIRTLDGSGLLILPDTANQIALVVAS